MQNIDDCNTGKLFIDSSIQLDQCEKEKKMLSIVERITENITDAITDAFSVIVQRIITDAFKHNKAMLKKTSVRISLIVQRIAVMLLNTAKQII